MNIMNVFVIVAEDTSILLRCLEVSVIDLFGNLAASESIIVMTARGLGHGGNP
jgi:hypothetical protein